MSFSARDKAKIVRTVRKNIYNTPGAGTRAPVNGDGRPIEGFFAQIVNAGPDSEADYSDARYWFKLVQLATTGNDGDEANTWAVPATDHPDYTHSTLEDLASKRSDDRILNADDIVWVWMSADINNDTTCVRYFCDSGGGGGLPEGQYQGQFYGMPAANSAAWTFVFAHPMFE